jgi:ribonuclease T2
MESTARKGRFNPMVRSMIRALLCCCVIAALGGAVLARGREGGSPGQFDFYLLSLSWSPSFCALEGDRSAARRGQSECRNRPYGFVVHGLWPQYNRGFPEACQVPPPRLDRAIVAAMLDLMPAPRLVYNEWDRHGTCSGLSARDYFATIRKARAAVTIPPEFQNLHQALVVSPDAVKDAFIRANPGLQRGDIAVGCHGRRLSDVRLCLSRDLKYRACPDVVAHSCRRDELLMAPMRGKASDAAGSVR